MEKGWRVFGLVLLVGVFLVGIIGCGGGKKEGKTAASESAGGGDSGPSYNYEEFAPLPSIMTGEITLPMLLDDTGPVEISCFEPQELEPAVGGFDYKALVEKNNKYVKELIYRWFIDDVGPATLSMEDTNSWEVSIGNPTVMEVDTDKLRFVEGQECITDETGWLSDGTRAVTTIIGAKYFEFTTKKPIGVTTQEDMVEAAKEKEITIESEAIGKYKPALDENGEQKLTDDGDLIFIGPGGVEIVETKMPPESERAMKEWSLEVKSPIYFAYQTIPGDSWNRENKKKTCDAFLVWGDVTPRAPECDELKDITFAVEKKGEDGLAVEITYGDDAIPVETSFETTEKVTLGNRIILWMNIKKMDEGALVRTNSVSVGSSASY